MRGRERERERCLAGGHTRNIKRGMIAHPRPNAGERERERERESVFGWWGGRGERRHLLVIGWNLPPPFIHAPRSLTVSPGGRWGTVGTAIKAREKSRTGHSFRLVFCFGRPKTPPRHLPPPPHNGRLHVPRCSRILPQAGGWRGVQSRRRVARFGECCVVGPCGNRWGRLAPPPRPRLPHLPSWTRLNIITHTYEAEAGGAGGARGLEGTAREGSHQSPADAFSLPPPAPRRPRPHHTPPAPPRSSWRLWVGGGAANEAGRDRGGGPHLPLRRRLPAYSPRADTLLFVRGFSGPRVVCAPPHPNRTRDPHAPLATPRASLPPRCRGRRQPTAAPTTPARARAPAPAPQCGAACPTCPSRHCPRWRWRRWSKPALCVVRRGGEAREREERERGMQHAVLRRGARTAGRHTTKHPRVCVPLLPPCGDGGDHTSPCTHTTHTHTLTPLSPKPTHHSTHRTTSPSPPTRAACGP